MSLLTRKVLLLNASYEALGTIYVLRAARLIWRGSAEMVEPDGNQVLRSQRFEFPQPSVVRLVEYIDVRGRQRRSSSKRTRILARDGYRCPGCGQHYLLWRGSGRWDGAVSEAMAESATLVDLRANPFSYCGCCELLDFTIEEPGVGGVRYAQ
jgi:hypothetical protein